MLQVVTTISYDTRNMNRLHTADMPQRIPQLRRLLTALQPAVDDFTFQPDAPTGISDHHLLNIRRIVEPHLERHGNLDSDGMKDVTIIPGEGPLRPIFFQAYQ